MPVNWLTVLAKIRRLPEKVRRAVGFYLHSSGKALVPRAGEKSCVQAFERTAPVLPLRWGQVERRFGLLTEKQPRGGNHRSARELEEAIAGYVESTNAQSKPFVWTRTADDMLASLHRFCVQTCNSGH